MLISINVLEPACSLKETKMPIPILVIYVLPAGTIILVLHVLCENLSRGRAVEFV